MSYALHLRLHIPFSLHIFFCLIVIGARFCYSKHGSFSDARGDRDSSFICPHSPCNPICIPSVFSLLYGLFYMVLYCFNGVYSFRVMFVFLPAVMAFFHFITGHLPAEEWSRFILPNIRYSRTCSSSCDCHSYSIHATSGSSCAVFSFDSGLFFPLGNVPK